MYVYVGASFRPTNINICFEVVFKNVLIHTLYRKAMSYHGQHKSTCKLSKHLSLFVSLPN